MVWLQSGKHDGHAHPRPSLHSRPRCREHDHLPLLRRLDGLLLAGARRAAQAPRHRGLLQRHFGGSGGCDGGLREHQALGVRHHRARGWRALPGSLDDAEAAALRGRRCRGRLRSAWRQWLLGHHRSRPLREPCRGHRRQRLVLRRQPAAGANYRGLAHLALERLAQRADLHASAPLRPAPDERQLPGQGGGHDGALTGQGLYGSRHRPCLKTPFVPASLSQPSSSDRQGKRIVASHLLGRQSGQWKQ
mmetsp:Transcript_54611/g.154751  ORF Transcript_54611/g.154751 Transcript_54611/m.154751 type:complete len:248 (-) Transcript_54611:5-748(-)